LTITPIRIRAPRMSDHIRGGLLTSKENTLSAVSPSPYPAEAEMLVNIIDFLVSNSFIHYEVSMTILN